MKLPKLIYISLLLFIGSSCTSSPPIQPDQNRNKVLLIYIDGFRADYLDKTDTPAFDELIADGVQSEGMIPVFPTKTFPNHYTIVTGLYPENSGVIANTMYDPEFDATYRIGDRSAVEDPRWYQGEPIWNTAEKQGLKAGTMFWVGSEAPIQNMRPTYWKNYDGRMPNKARIDTVSKWLSEEGGDIGIATLYFSFLDGVGHNFGPDSQEIVDAIKEADELVAYLTSTLREKGLLESTNIILVADHGMSQLSTEKVIFLDDIADLTDVRRVGSSPVVGLVTDGEHRDRLYKDLKENEEHYRVYKKEDLPDRYHLKNHRRVPGLLMIADEGYTIITRESFARRENAITGGNHGFDNNEIVMDALFIAHGPDFKKGLKIGRFENVHVYELMNHLLGTKPAKNDGSLEELSGIIN